MAVASGDAASDKRYYRIGEVAKITDVKPYVLRYWESEFRWMAPQKSKSKQRLYRRRDIDMIQLIKKLLYEQRYTIAGARKKLRELGTGSRSGASKNVPLPITPTQCLSSTCPPTTASWSIFRARTPQSRARMVRTRSRNTASLYRSHCWKWCGVRNIPSSHRIR